MRGQGGTLGYANAKSWGTTTQPNASRAKTAFWLAVALGILTLLGMGLEAWELTQLNALERGTLTPADAEPLVMAAGVWGLAYLVALICFLVFFMMWLYRAVKNVRITTGDSRSGPGMSVGWWFIPFANLVMPYLVLKDLAERVRWGNASAVGLFWLLWIGSGIATRITDRLYGAALDTLDYDQGRMMLYIGMAGTVASAAAWVVLAWIVQQVQRHQQPQSM